MGFMSGDSNQGEAKQVSPFSALIVGLPIVVIALGWYFLHNFGRFLPIIIVVAVLVGAYMLISRKPKAKVRR